MRKIKNFSLFKALRCQSGIKRIFRRTEEQKQGAIKNATSKTGDLGFDILEGNSTQKIQIFIELGITKKTKKLKK